MNNSLFVASLLFICSSVIFNSSVLATDDLSMAQQEIQIKQIRAKRIRRHIETEKLQRIALRLQLTNSETELQGEFGSAPRHAQIDDLLERLIEDLQGVDYKIVKITHDLGKVTIDIPIQWFEYLIDHPRVKNISDPVRDEQMEIRTPKRILSRAEIAEKESIRQQKLAQWAQWIRAKLASGHYAYYPTAFKLRVGEDATQAEIDKTVNLFRQALPENTYQNFNPYRKMGDKMVVTLEINAAAVDPIVNNDSVTIFSFSVPAQE